MLTLREFIEKINFREHFRVYQMNMDGLIYESYYTVHSPYFFDKEHEEKREYFNDKYYSDNRFCDDVRTKENRGIDEETTIFLEKFGNYKVIGLGCGSFRPHDIYRDSNGELHIKYYDEDPLRPGIAGDINCFNIFIL